MGQLDEIVLTHHEKQIQERELRCLAGVDVLGGVRQTDPATVLPDLISGLEALDKVVEAGDVVRIFVDLAERQGGRLLLLRNWGEGLRVMLAQGVELPPRLLDPKSIRPKVIALRETDIFMVLSREKVVYSGPFPLEYFPPELSRVLHASEDRPILLVPLPLRGRWGTYLYLDWLSFEGAERIRGVTALARYAVMRLHGLEHDVLPVGLHTQTIHAAQMKAQHERELTSCADLKPGELPPERIFGMLGELTALPQVAGRILELLGDPRTTAAQLEKEIARDLVLTARMLRVANSSFYEGNSEIKAIRDAVVRLGFKTVRNWTLVAASRAVFPGVDTSPLLHRIWSRSVRSAVASQIVAEERGLDDCEIAFVGGLMQNIGQLILARALPGLCEHIEQTSLEREVPLWRVEKELLGYDHGTLGALLIDDWGLSRRLAQAVRHHHDLELDNDPEGLGTVIGLGEDLVQCAEVEDPWSWERYHRESAAARKLGVDLELFGTLARRLVDVSLDDLD
ncbi:HDOD domain-containing protein [bacterium]|nr:HDOD domain-containing protein [bacterium]MBU1072480.1 HDOD domain-containing protein [bacterium]MBU1674216.1 HDOD domain-containing protein [bacterium]